VKLIVLGNEAAGDDGAAFVAVNRVIKKVAASETNKSADTIPSIVFAGRPDTELLDLLDSPEPVILVDVVLESGQPGHVITLSFDELITGVIPVTSVSSHGFGPAEILKLGQALGRPLPNGCFVGIEGIDFDAGHPLSEPVARAMDEFVDCIQAAIADFTDS
jgi:hydrogenase maturation protease